LIEVCALFRTNEPPKRVQSAFLDAVQNSATLAELEEFGLTDET
jgi:hypothetical protein